jgi:hypothetical protein
MVPVTKPVFAGGGFQDQLLGQNRNGRATGYYCLQVAALPDAAAVLIGVDEFLDGQTQLNFVNAGLVEVAAGRNQLGTGAPAHSDFSILVATLVHNHRHGGN